MVVCEHRLVCVTVDDGFTLWGALTAHLELRDELRFLVLSEVVTEELRRLKFLTHDPEGHL